MQKTPDTIELDGFSSVTSIDQLPKATNELHVRKQAEHQMGRITRRSLLGSLALGSIYTNVEHSSALHLQGTEPNKEQTDEIFWTIARQHPRSDWAHVDFWSKPLCEGAYAAQLPLTIGRGTLMFGTIDNQANAGLSHFDSSLREKHNKLFSDRLCFQSGAGINSLTELLRTRVNVNVKSRRARTTALIALDSRWSTRAGLDWAEILPAFRGCYDQVIGHYHVNQRGFHHWKNWMKEGPFNSSSFERFFTSAASQCDAVVFTSQSLIENDTHLSARASTESLIGELMQRFSQVLFDDEIIRDVVPTGQANCESKQPRIYALGSAGASQTHPAVALADLCRQRELTFSSFGKPMLRPLIVGLGLDERSAESVRTQITEQTNMLFLNAWVTSKPDFYDENAEWLKFVTLWPFDPDYGPWP